VAVSAIALMNRIQFMRCTVLLFAQAREVAKAERIVLELPDSATVADAMRVLFERTPALLALRDRLAVAVDERYALQEMRLHDDCTMAVIPPVSGG
jgi:molybdopterin converting factor subunit 1